ncbi:MAG: aldo/keto reductase, partial [Candidatus Humimicrobiaceae bacterium]
MPVFGIGTWMMGGDVLHDTANDDNADIRAIREAIELGVTHIDSSEAYANGYSEILISKAIKEYRREDLFIATKVWPLNLHYEDVIKSTKRSLERLATDYIDLYIIHYPNPKIP